MKHLQLVLNVIATNTGLLALLSSLILLNKTRKREYIYRILIIISFMFIFIPFLIYNYFFNLKETSIFYSTELPSYGIIFLIPTLIFYTNKICKLRRFKEVNITFSAYALFALIHFVWSLTSAEAQNISIIIHSIGLGISIIYIGIIFLKGDYDTLTKSIKTNRRFVGLLALLFLPLFIIFDIVRVIDIFEILHISRTIIAVPVFFTVWTLFFIHEDVISMVYRKNVKSYKDYCKNIKLTPREVEACELLIKGYTYEEIGNTLFVSKETIKTHVKNIYSKAEVSNKIQLISKIEKFTN